MFLIGFCVLRCHLAGHLGYQLGGGLQGCCTQEVKCFPVRKHCHRVWGRSEYCHILHDFHWFLLISHAKICAPLLDLTQTSQHLPSRDTGPVKVQWHSCNCKGLIWNPPVVSGLWPLLWWAVFWETNSQRAATCGCGKVRAPFLGGEVGLSAWGFDKWSVKEKSWDLHILSYSSLRYNWYNCIFAPGKGSGGQTPCQLKIGLITWSWLVYFVFFEGWSSFRLVTSETAAKGQDSPRWSLCALKRPIKKVRCRGMVRLLPWPRWVQGSWEGFWSDGSMRVSVHPKVSFWGCGTTVVLWCSYLTCRDAKQGEGQVTVWVTCKLRTNQSTRRVYLRFQSKWCYLCMAVVLTLMKMTKTKCKNKQSDDWSCCCQDGKRNRRPYFDDDAGGE